MVIAPSNCLFYLSFLQLPDMREIQLAAQMRIVTVKWNISNLGDF